MPNNTRANEKTPGAQMLSADERIRRRAYERYVARGCQPGRELDDWLQAEREIRGASNSDEDQSSFAVRSRSRVRAFLRGMTESVVAIIHRVAETRIPLWATVAMVGLGLIVPLARLGASLL